MNYSTLYVMDSGPVSYFLHNNLFDKATIGLTCDPKVRTYY